MAKKDLTKMLSAQAASRKQEISSIVAGEPSEEKKRGRKPSYSAEDPKCNMTLVLPVSLRDRVKMHALRNHTTVSELFGAWIEENCDEI